MLAVVLLFTHVLASAFTTFLLVGKVSYGSRLSTLVHTVFYHNNSYG